MEVGKVYMIRLGKYSDQYLCTGVGVLGYDLRRVRLGKTKIDNVRLPSDIFITYIFQQPKTLKP